MPVNDQNEYTDITSFSLENYRDSFERFFASFITAYKLKLSLSRHRATLEGEKCEVTFSTERYYFDFIVCFREVSTGKQVVLLKVMEQKELIGKTNLDPSELATYKQLNKVEKAIFHSSVLIRKHALDLLSGDFSLYN